jgi:hypothetical protein
VPVSEQQLKTWTSLGSVAQSRDTYNGIKSVLEDKNAPYADKANIEVRLQGSYGNDTNVYGDSDVDIVLCQRNLFYYDINGLNESDQAAFKRDHPNTAEYDIPKFKSDVVAWLSKHYPEDFDPAKGNKALHIKGRNNRRNADILVCGQHKKYSAYPNPDGAKFAEGVIFFPRNGNSIVNYPKKHSDNLTQKHQETGEWLKPTIRIFKNIRTRMWQIGIIGDGAAPSYFIESLLYNAPDGLFRDNYQTTVESLIKFAEITDPSKLVCANYQHWLVRDNQSTSWPSENYKSFVHGLRSFYTNFSS